MTEVKATLSFGGLKRGDRLQVDIHDPHVARLIKARYLKVIWKEPDAAAVDDRSGAGDVSTDRVDVGVARPKKAKKVNGGGEDHSEPAAGDPDSAPAGRSPHPQDQQPDH